MSLIKMDLCTQSVIDLLNTSPLQTLNIQGLIENTPADHLEIWVDSEENPTGVLVRKGYFCYIYTLEHQFLDLLLAHYFEADFYGFSGLSRFVGSYLLPHFTLEWSEFCDLYVLPAGGLNCGLKKGSPSSITLGYAEEINDYYTYKDEDSIYKIRGNIENRPSSGYFQGDELLSWVLVHEDNSIGVMYTKEGHRGKGIAVDLTIDICEKILRLNKTPFLQISEKNTMSPGLAIKCGFEPYVDHRGNSKGGAMWFGGFREIPKKD